MFRLLKYTGFLCINIANTIEKKVLIYALVRVSRNNLIQVLLSNEILNIYGCNCQSLIWCQHRSFYLILTTGPDEVGLHGKAGA